MFVCREVNGTSYLYADFNLHCYDDRWQTYLPIILVFVLLYPVGIPVVLFIMLWKHSRRINSPDPVVRAEARREHSLEFLHDAYSKSMWFFELLDLMHKLFLTSLVVFFHETAQLPVAMGVCVLYTITILLTTPYIRRIDDTMHICVQVEIFLLLLAGHVVEHEGTLGVASLLDLLLSALLIALVIAVFLLFLLHVILNLRRTIRDMQRQAMKEQAEAEARKTMNEKSNSASDLNATNSAAGETGSELQSPSMRTGKAGSSKRLISTSGNNEGIELADR
jgi:hypothetical protein